MAQSVSVVAQPLLADAVDFERHGRYVIRTEDGPIAKFRGRICDDGSTPFVAEADRYHLYLVKGCPWAHRASITVHLLGLEGIITQSILDDVRDARGWGFRERYGPDPVLGLPFLRDVYLRTDPDFIGHVNVPTLYDRKLRKVVNNESDEVIEMLTTAFRDFSTTGVDLYPEALRDEIAVLSAEIATNLSFNVYQVGQVLPEAVLREIESKRALSGSPLTPQERYDADVARLFATLDKLEARLADRRYLFGAKIVDSDLRLWAVLARFDCVYYPLFQCSLRRITDYPNLWAYARDLYSLPAFQALTDFEAFKRTYYSSFPQIHPSSVMPIGPDIDWKAPQSRAELSNR